MNNVNSSDWKVDCPGPTRDGCVCYHEGSRSISLYWELGGSGVALIIYVGKPSDWATQHPWAQHRQSEILDRIDQEVIQAVREGRLVAL